MVAQVAITGGGNRTALVRDLHSKALLETNPAAHEEYVAKKKAILNSKARINSLEDRMANIESLLMKLLEK